MDAKPKRFLDAPYRLPFAKYLAEFEVGFYFDFDVQLRIMGDWLLENNCKTALDIGAQTGGCIEYIDSLGIKMDGTQYTTDLKRLTAVRLNEAGVKSRLFVSPIHRTLKIPSGFKYDSAVMLGWFNLPFSHREMKNFLRAVYDLLEPHGIVLFDYFQFKDVVVNPAEAIRFDDGILFISHTELLGEKKVLRRYHFWVLGKRVRSEVTDLVDRNKDEVLSILERSGFMVAKSTFLKLNYPREFVLAKKT